MQRTTPETPLHTPCAINPINPTHWLATPPKTTTPTPKQRAPSCPWHSTHPQCNMPLSQWQAPAIVASTDFRQTAKGIHKWQARLYTKLRCRPKDTLIRHASIHAAQHTCTHTTTHTYTQHISWPLAAQSAKTNRAHHNPTLLLLQLAPVRAKPENPFRIFQKLGATHDCPTPCFLPKPDSCHVAGVAQGLRSDWPSRQKCAGAVCTLPCHTCPLQPMDRSDRLWGAQTSRHAG
jgi:hypothetical protein